MNHRTQGQKTSSCHSAKTKWTQQHPYHHCSGSTRRVAQLWPVHKWSSSTSRQSQSHFNLKLSLNMSSRQKKQQSLHDTRRSRIPSMTYCKFVKALQQSLHELFSLPGMKTTWIFLWPCWLQFMLIANECGFPESTRIPKKQTWLLRKKPSATSKV